MKNRKIIVGLSILIPVLALLEFYVVGPLLVDNVNMLAARCLLLGSGIVFMLIGIVLLVKTSGVCKLYFVPSIAMGLFFILEYFLYEALKEIRF